MRFVAAIAALSVLASAAFAQAALPYWKQASPRWATPETTPIVQRLANYRLVDLDVQTFRDQLEKAPLDTNGIVSGDPVRITLPMPDGTLARFDAVESPILSPQLQAVMPWSKEYYAQGVDDPTASVRMGFNLEGFYASVLTPRGDFHIDPYQKGDQRTYFSYFRRDLAPKFDGWQCFGAIEFELPRSSYSRFVMARGGAGSGPTLKTFRLAMNATGEYTAARGGTVNSARSAIIASVNRVTGVYERDFCARLNLVYSNPYTNSATDPFTNADGFAMLNQNQNDLDVKWGNANYDIGHVFSTGGGGVAGLGVVGIAGSKGLGVTGSPSPVGDAFDIDYVAHEMGHQFGGNHTFNGTTGACGGGNRASNAAYEPGSGSTIMAYAGICGSEDLQPNSDAYFHTKSYSEMIVIRDRAASNGVSSATGNNAPIVDAGATFTIPIGTPFKLTAVGSDPDGHALTYCWEQFDLGTASPTTNNTTRPLFRSFNPSTSPTRIFPNLTSLLAGSATPWEILPTVARTLNFRVTARDNRAGGGGSEFDSTSLTVAGTAFSVSAPNTAVTWNAGSTQTVTWNVGGGSVAPNVRILLSTDGGTSYGTGTATVLLASTPNDGSETVTVPWVHGTTNRIFVEAVGNVFFDVSNVNFTVSEANSTTLGVSPSSVVGGKPSVATVTITNPAPAGGLVFNLSDNSALVTTPATVTIPAGATSANVNLTTSPVASNTAVTVTVARTGWSKTAGLTLTPNTAPVATGETYNMTEDGTLNVSAPGVLSNDIDANGDTLTAQLVTAPASGSLTLNPNGSFTYTPPVNFTGVRTFVYRANDGISNSGNATVTINVNPIVQTFAGALTLDQFGGDVTTIPAVLEIRPVGSTTPVATFALTLSSTGFFSVDKNPRLAAGNYDFAVKASHWLRTVKTVSVAKSGALNLKFTLINGDIDGDNSVTVFDYALLSDAFDTSVGDPNWNPDADLDGDGSITVFDYAILSDSFDQNGAP